MQEAGSACQRKPLWLPYFATDEDRHAGIVPAEFVTGKGRLNRTASNLKRIQNIITCSRIILKFRKDVTGEQCGISNFPRCEPLLQVLHQLVKIFLGDLHEVDCHPVGVG